MIHYWYTLYYTPGTLLVHPILHPWYITGTPYITPLVHYWYTLYYTPGTLLVHPILHPWYITGTPYITPLVHYWYTYYTPGTLLVHPILHSWCTSDTLTCYEDSHVEDPLGLEGFACSKLIANTNACRYSSGQSRLKNRKQRVKPEQTKE